jgi:hypothetical protein
VIGVFGPDGPILLGIFVNPGVFGPKVVFGAFGLTGFGMFVAPGNLLLPNCVGDMFDMITAPYVSYGQTFLLLALGSFYGPNYP